MYNKQVFIGPYSLIWKITRRKKINIFSCIYLLKQTSYSLNYSVDDLDNMT